MATTTNNNKMNSKPPSAASSRSTTSSLLSAKLQSLQKQQQEKRHQLEEFFEQMQALKQHMTTLQEELLVLDGQVMDTEMALGSQEQQQQEEEEEEEEGMVEGSGCTHVSGTVAGEEGMTMAMRLSVPSGNNQPQVAAGKVGKQGPSAAPPTFIESHWEDDMDDDDDDDHEEPPSPPCEELTEPPPSLFGDLVARKSTTSHAHAHAHAQSNLVTHPAAAAASWSTGSTAGVVRSNLPSGLLPSHPHHAGKSASSSSTTLDQHFFRPAAVGRSTQGAISVEEDEDIAVAVGETAAAAAGAVEEQDPPWLTRPSNNNTGVGYKQRNHASEGFGQDLSRDNSPWSEQMQSILQKTFHLPTFRPPQKQIIQTTLLNHDAFVIMRTGGGKSLTYQLPAVLQAPQHKITLVISPLLSLIQDQEEQMNAIVPNSALAFTSGLPGGQAEHARRWARVRDVHGGVLLVFVTPEKLQKSGKLKHELEKLYEEKRLGRFVVDECHCCSQWGHDFRPDYTKLGTLKHHFPTVPMLAVTATASTKVRHDVARILKLSPNYKFFQSSANRPNLTYAIRPKPDSKPKLLQNIASFIKERHPKGAGIVYTFSRREADEVAEKLCDLGVVARSYHGSVNETVKKLVHRSWMRNETQVVVATIAFGLGINKPDVRFVLHHSLSKTLESYYQESGRAGRDGKPADCILYYSTKDVPRMLCMIHGESSETSFWSMVGYAQEGGNDVMCRSIILQVLGDPKAIEMRRGQQGGEGEGALALCPDMEERDVTVHAKTVVELVVHVQRSRDDVTMAQLVAMWRSAKDPPACVRNNPPSKDLTKDECERLIVALMLRDVLHPKIAWSNPYTSSMYITPGLKAQPFLQSREAKVKVKFPTKKARAAASSFSGIASLSTTSTPRTKRVPAQGSTEDGWISARKQKRKSSTARNKTTATASASATTATAGSAKRSKKKPSASASATSKRRGSSSSGGAKKTYSLQKDDDVIELVATSSDEDDAEVISSLRKRRACKETAEKRKARRENLDLFDDSPSDSEYEFE